MKKINIDMNHSSKPSAIEYRLKRAFNAASVCRQFLEGVDLLSQGIALSEARTLAGRLEALVGEIREAAPQKRIHGRKARAAAVRTSLAAVAADPAQASTESLLDAYMQAPDPATRGQLWTEVSKRYAENRHAIGQAIGAATRRNAERLAGQAKHGNVWNPEMKRTERARVR